MTDSYSKSERQRRRKRMKALHADPAFKAAARERMKAVWAKWKADR